MGTMLVTARCLSYRNLVALYLNRKIVHFTILHSTLTDINPPLLVSWTDMAMSVHGVVHHGVVLNEETQETAARNILEQLAAQEP
ncbi:MAG TPA: hypothetical protein VKM55_04320 [Candidatus Lokiarchaeia archaeon]|nr:hypothetical protein [Candidatus Lokiarchaeia archaeon]